MIRYEDPRTPSIAVVFTGGTISMAFDPVVGGAVPRLSGLEILAHVEDVDGLANVVEAVQFGLFPGPHMTPSRMFELTRLLRSLVNRDDIDGVVVTHGTDTMEETAYLADLVLSTRKPVVFVGAMRNSSESGWDGPANLRAALRVAADLESADRGVLITMGDLVLSAQDAVKTHSEAVDTFKPRDFGPLGIIDKDRVIYMGRRERKEWLDPDRLEHRVEVIKLSAGSSGFLVDAAVTAGLRGLVLEGLGRGNQPVTAVAAIERALEAGLPVVLCSRCPTGRVLDTYAYDGGAYKLRQAGAILGGMLPSHKARIKLMLLLGAGRSHDEIRASFEN